MDLDQLSTNAKISEKSSAPFMQPEIKETAKKGRPPLTDEEKKRRAEEQKTKAKAGKSQAAGPQVGPQPGPAPTGPSIPTSLIMKPVAQFVSTLGVGYVGDPRAGMTPDELENVATALGLVLDKYAPMLFDKYAAECMLAIALGQYSLRIIAMKKALDLEKAQRTKQFQAVQTDPVMKQFVNEQKEQQPS